MCLRVRVGGAAGAGEGRRDRGCDGDNGGPTSACETRGLKTIKSHFSYDQFPLNPVKTSTANFALLATWQRADIAGETTAQEVVRPEGEKPSPTLELSSPCPSARRPGGRTPLPTPSQRHAARLAPATH